MVGCSLEHSFRALGLGLGATETEVKVAYRALARIYHPDKHDPARTGIMHSFFGVLQDHQQCSIIPLQSSLTPVSPGVSPPTTKLHDLPNNKKIDQNYQRPPTSTYHRKNLYSTSHFITHTTKKNHTTSPWRPTTSLPSEAPTMLPTYTPPRSSHECRPFYQK